jgi:hypothetical protein
MVASAPRTVPWATLGVSGTWFIYNTILIGYLTTCTCANITLVQAAGTRAPQRLDLHGQEQIAPATLRYTFTITRAQPSSTRPCGILELGRPDSPLFRTFTPDVA